MKNFRTISPFLIGMILLTFIIPVQSAPVNVSVNPVPALLWSAPTGSTAFMSEHAAKVACSDDGKQVMAGYGAGIAELRDRQGRVLWRWQSSRPYYTVRQVTLSRDGEHAGLVLYDPLQNNKGEFDYFDRAGNLLWTYPLENAFGFASLSMDGGVVALGDGNRISFFNMTGNRIGTTVLEGFLLDVAISDDGSIAATGISKRDFSGNLYAIDPDGTILWSSSTIFRSEETAVSGDGQYIAGTESNRLRYFTAGGDRLWNFNSSPKFTGIAVSDNGAYVAASSQYYLRYFDAPGVILWQYEVPSLPIRAGPYVGHLSMSGDGGYISVTTGGNRTLFFDRNGTILWQQENPLSIVSTCLSRNGKNLAQGTEQEIRYFDTGIDVPADETAPAMVTTTEKTSLSPSPTPQVTVPALLVPAGILAGILARRKR